MNEHLTLPSEFQERTKARLGQEFDSFIQSLQQASPISVRVNPHKVNQLGVIENVPWSAMGYYLNQRPSFTLDPHLHAGAYYVQEASSMFLEQAIKSIGSLDNLKVLDLCAAPGGKSTHLLSLLPHDSLLVTNEVIRSRSHILSENIQKWGHSNVIVTNNDPADFSALEGYFDIIVVDAPCSGEGLFRKDPDAIAEWSVNNVELCSKRQQRILKDIWPALKENGILIYSTCTYSEFENEENIKWLKSQHNIEAIKIDISPNWAINTLDIGSFQGYQFYPHKVKGEGFFLCALRKKENQQTRRLKIKNELAPVLEKIKTAVSPLIHNPTSKFFWQWSDRIQFIEEKHFQTVNELMGKLNFVSIGTSLASFKHDKVIPEHAMALSIHLHKENQPSVSVSREEALKYLRKDIMSVETSTAGFTLINYEGNSLGWVNVLSNRINNMYPKEWRIRMAV